MNGWRAALRIARREAGRARGRSALVAALIGLPVLALSFLAVSYDSFQLTAEQELDRRIGAADAVVSWRYDGPAVQDHRGNIHRGETPEVLAREEPVTAAELESVLPAGARVVPRHTGTLELRTATGLGVLDVEWVDLTDPLHAGRVELREGHAPTTAGEAALTRHAATRLGATIGDQIESADGTQRWTVTGIGEIRFRFQEAVLLPPRETGASQWLVTTPEPVTWQQVRELNRHGIVVESRQVLLNPPPPSEVEVAFAAPDRDDGPVIALGALVTGLAVVEVMLLAGPAFAVGARRRQRQLAMVAANGGTPAQLRRIVLADGVVLGAAGAVGGIALGVAAALLLQPVLAEHVLGRPAAGTGLFPLALAGAAGLAVLTGVAAALVPAWVAARQPVVTALAGRRGQVRSRRRWLVLGLLAAAAGTATAVAGALRIETSLVLTGLILAQLGLVLCTPTLVGVAARLGPVLPLPARIALRDTARNRAATAPAVSAVMAAVTGALALGVFLTAADQRSQDTHQAGLPMGHAAVSFDVWEDDASRLVSSEQRSRVRVALAETLPATQVYEVAAPACPDSDDECAVSVPIPAENRCPAEDLRDARLRAAQVVYDDRALLTSAEQREARRDPRCQHPIRGWAVYLARTLVDDGTALPALVGGEPDDLAAATAMLNQGGVVVTDPRRMVDGRATLEIEVNDQPARQVSLAAYALTSGANVPFAVLSPDALAHAGLTAEPYGLVAATAAMPSQEELDALQQALVAVHPQLHAQVEHGRFHTEDPYLLVLAAIAAVVALAAAGIATGLAAADRRSDLATLGAVGASPRVRRLLATSQSGVIAGLGGLLGTAVGLGSAYAVLAALNQAETHVWPVEHSPYPLVFPGLAVGLLLVAVPAIAMLGAGLLTRSHLPVERRPS